MGFTFILEISQFIAASMSSATVSLKAAMISNAVLNVIL